MHCTVLYCKVLYCTVLHFTAWNARKPPEPSSAKANWLFMLSPPRKYLDYSTGRLTRKQSRLAAWPPSPHRAPVKYRSFPSPHLLLAGHVWTAFGGVWVWPVTGITPGTISPRLLPCHIAILPCSQAPFHHGYLPGSLAITQFAETISPRLLPWHSGDSHIGMTPCTISPRSLPSILPPSW